MKKMTKIMSAVLMILMIMSIATTVFADGFDPITINGSGSSVDTTKITNIGQGAVRIVTTIGMVASVIVLVVLGIKYMVGSAEEKAEYKKTLLPYVIGAVLIFAAASIASMIYSFAIGL